MRSRQYYILLKDGGRTDLEVLEDYDMGGFDLRKLWKGEPVEATLLTQVQLSLGLGAPSDLLANPLSWLIVSDRLQSILLPLTKAHVQYVPVTLIKGKHHVANYFIANPLGLIDAVIGHHARTRDLILEQLTLSQERIPADRHLFRLATHPTLTVMSPELLAALQDKGLQGLSAFKVKMKQ